MALPADFSKIFGSTATGGLTPIGDVNYAKGWEFVGANPPTKNDFSYLQNLSDLKSQWLYSNKLQRTDPFGDIKADGAVQTALSNLDLVGGLGVNTVGRLIGVRVFTSSQMYTPSDGTKSVIVYVVGAGGGGGGARGTTGNTLQSIGGGGGAGGFAKSILTTGFSSVSVTIGAGGAGGTATSSIGNHGQDGGDTSFGTVTATGGNGGDGSSTYAPTSTSSPLRILGRQGGVGSGNLISAYGGTGGDGTFFQWSIPTSSSYSGSGGDSIFGAGGYKWGSFDSDVNPYANAISPGAGGAGASNKTGSENGIVGGQGANGIVIIEEYA